MTADTDAFVEGTVLELRAGIVVVVDIDVVVGVKQSTQTSPQFSPKNSDSKTPREPLSQTLMVLLLLYLISVCVCFDLVLWSSFVVVLTVL